VPGAAVKDEMAGLESRKIEIQQFLSEAPAPTLRLHPNLTEVYRRKVANLHEALADESTKAEAVSALRSLVDEIRLVPTAGKLKIEFYGALAAMLALGMPQNKHPQGIAPGVQLTMVAGTCSNLNLLLEKIVSTQSALMAQQIE
jgi:site-specific DNA recombinase